MIKSLRNKRKGRARANRAEIENRTAKVLFVRQDRDGTGATALVTSGDVGRGQITTDRSSRWRPAFKFCDDLQGTSVRTPQRGVPTSARNNGCGVAFARIANARSRKSRAARSARSRATTSRFRSRISERIVAIISSDLSRESAPPASMPPVHYRCFHTPLLLRFENRSPRQRDTAPQQRL